MFHHPKRFEPPMAKLWSKRTKSETLLAAWRSFILSREQIVVKPWQGKHTDMGSPRIAGAKHRSYCQLTKCFTDMPMIKILYCQPPSPHIPKCAIWPKARQWILPFLGFGCELTMSLTYKLHHLLTFCDI